MEKLDIGFVSHIKNISNSSYDAGCDCDGGCQAGGCDCDCFDSGDCHGCDCDGGGGNGL